MNRVIEQHNAQPAGFLAISGLQKSYGDAVVVSSIDLQVKKGEFLSLLGPSGCGKTTTLQMVAGFVVPTKGDVVLDGRDLNSIPVNKRGIGIVFQNYALFPHMTVAQNVAFGLVMRKVAKPEMDRRVQQVLDMVHLSKLGGRYPRELSGGQQQRVALARALVFEPSLLLLDEPFSNLDAKLKEEMQIELRLLQRELQITTILVTHDQGEALGLSDRVAVMEAGRIVQIDAPYDVYERPRTDFVGQFLGKTNVLTIPAGRLGASPGNGSAEGAISVRPEKLLFANNDAGGAGIAGKVSARIFQGASWLYQVDTEYGRILVCRPNDGSKQHEEGESVHLALVSPHEREKQDALR